MISEQTFGVLAGVFTGVLGTVLFGVFTGVFNGVLIGVFFGVLTGVRKDTCKCYRYYYQRSMVKIQGENDIAFLVGRLSGCFSW